jgi:hypothetical protein
MDVFESSLCEIIKKKLEESNRELSFQRNKKKLSQDSAKTEADPESSSSNIPYIQNVNK